MRLIRDPSTNKCKGFGYVAFKVFGQQQLRSFDNQYLHRLSISMSFMWPTVTSIFWPPLLNFWPPVPSYRLATSVSLNHLTSIMPNRTLEPFVNIFTKHHNQIGITILISLIRCPDRLCCFGRSLAARDRDSRSRNPNPALQTQQKEAATCTRSKDQSMYADTLTPLWSTGNFP